MRDSPLSEDGYSDDTLDKANHGVVPNGEVVMNAFPHFAKNNKRKSHSYRSYTDNGNKQERGYIQWFQDLVTKVKNMFNRIPNTLRVTYKRSNGPLDVISVVVFNTIKIFAKDERWSGDKDDSSQSKNSEDTVPDCAFLLQENPSQERSKNWITKER